MSRTSPRPRGGRATRTMRTGPWYRRIDWIASVWVVILIVPLLLVVRSRLPVLVRATSLTGIMGFAGAYVWGVSTMTAWFELPLGASLVRQLRETAARLALLVGLAALSLPALGWWYIFYLPYLCAVILYATPLRTGLAISTGIYALAVAMAVLTHDLGIVSGTLGCSGSSLFVALSRIWEEVNERRLVKEVELASSMEREEIGRDVHDVLGHSLTLLTLKAEVAQRLVRVDPGAAEAELSEIIRFSRQALADVRATVTRLRTPDLASQVEASRTAFSAAAVRATIRGDARDVPLPQREVLAWALREATTNVARHAGACGVWVDLEPGHLRVVDDGVGAAGAPAGNGLTGLRERIEVSGGTLTVTSPAPSAPWNRDGESRESHGPGTELEVFL